MDAWILVLVGIALTYFGIGLLLNILIFFWAKLRDLDRHHSEWATVLTSVWGFIYFLFVGSLLWLPVLVSFLIGDRGTKRLNENSWMWRFRHPFISLKRLVNQYYQ